MTLSVNNLGVISIHNSCQFTFVDKVQYQSNLLHVGISIIIFLDLQIFVR